MENIKPISTKIEQIIKAGENLIVRENYYKFEGQSNIYSLREGKINWFAELPSEEDYYSNEIIIQNNKIITGSWNGFTVELDIATGMILSKTFTK